MIRGSVLRTGAYVLGALMSLASVPLLLRYLGVVDFGRFQTIQSLGTIVAGVTEAGLTALGVREFATRDAAGRRALLRTLLGLRITLTVLGIACAVVFTLVARYPGVLVVGTVITGAGVLVFAISGSYAIVLTGTLRLGWIAFIDIVRQGVTVAAIVLLVVLDAPLVAFFAAALVANIVDLAVCLVITRGQVPLLPSPRISEWMGLLRHVLPFAVATAVGIVYFRVTLIVMSLVVGDEEVGHFSASFRIIEAMGGFAWLLVNSAFPVVARAAGTDRLRLRYTLERVFDVVLIVGAAGGLGTVIGAPFIIAVAAGDQFTESVPVLRLHGLSLFGTFLVALGGFTLLALHQYRALLVINGVALAAAIGVTLVAAPPLGAVGGGISSVTAELVLVVGYGIALVTSNPDLRFRPRTLLPVCGAVAAGAVVALLVPAGSAVQSMAAVAVYFGVLLAARAIPEEIAEALPVPGRSRPR